MTHFAHKMTIPDPWRSFRPSVLRALSATNEDLSLENLANHLTEDDRLLTSTRLRDDLISLIEDGLVSQNADGSFTATELGQQLGSQSIGASIPSRPESNSDETPHTTEQTETRVTS